MQKLKQRFAKFKAFVRTLPLRTYLWYLIVASLVCTGITVSSYVSTSRGGDSVRVALFANDVSISVPITEDCYPGCSFEIPITVSNYEVDGLTEYVCDVSQEYTLEAQLLVGNLPLTVSWKNGDDSGLFNANDPATDYTHYVVITWPVDAESVSYEYSDEIEVLRVIAISEQVN